MTPEFMFNNTFKCFRITTELAQHSNITDLMGTAHRRDLKAKVIESIYAEIQFKRQSEQLFNDLLNDSIDYGFEDLQRMIKVSHRTETLDAEEGGNKYQVNYLSVRGTDPNLLKPQLFIFVTHIDSSDEFKTVLLVRANPKFNNVVLKYLVNNVGLLLSPAKLSTNTLKSCLDANISRIIALKSDLELSFGRMSTIDNSLSNITIKLGPSDVKNLAQKEKEFSESLFKHLQEGTSINFQKIELVKVQCNLFYLSGEGKIRLYIDTVDQPGNSSWFVLQNLF